MAKPRYTEEQYQYARYEANALEYARQRGYDLVKSGPQWRMREHDSMVFTEDGRWFWNSRALRGRAIEFAMHYEGLSLVQAVLSICGHGRGAPIPPPSATTAKKPEKKPFVLPEKSEENKRLFAYLCGTRRLDREIVSELVKSGDVYESAQSYTKTDGTAATAHNAVFVGRDRDGVPKSAFQRGLSSLPGSKPFKRDVAGSDAAASFCIHGREGVKTVAVFEASIDAISHATLEKLAGRDWRDIDRVAQGGTEKTDGLLAYLDAHPDVNTVLLCYDEDAGGETAVERTKRLLEGRGLHIERRHPAIGKDWNEYLCALYEDPDVLARDALRQVTAKPERFMRFLKTAGNNYKYPFEDQLLIYAQRPDATACADVPTWSRLGRSVTGYVGGIVLLGDAEKPDELRVVFDVANTTAADGRALWLWRLGEERTAAAVEALGSMADTSETALIAAIRTAVDAEIENQTGRQLEDGDPFTELLRVGANYAVLSRCGVDADAIYAPEDLAALSWFHEPEAARELGNAIGGTTETLLRRIEAAEKQYEKNLRANLTMAKKRPYDEPTKEEGSAGHEREGSSADGGASTEDAEPENGAATNSVEEDPLLEAARRMVAEAAAREPEEEDEPEL